MARTVVITGGTAGIGLATAEKFAREGWNVGIIARGQDRLWQAEAQIARFRTGVLGVEADVADHDAVERAADRIAASLGPIDAWVNNAMATIVAPSSKISPAEFRRVTDVTYHGQVFGTLVALKHMRPRNRGAIIQINSVLGIRAYPLQSAYCGAKSAALGFTDSLRGELLHEGVGVTLTSIFLPAVNTPQFGGWVRNRTGREQIAPPPVYDPRLCANAVFFAVEHPRRDVWVSRTSVMASVLQRFWPNAADVQAKSGWDGQLSHKRIPYLPGNLFEPGAGKAAIDGPFAAQASSARRSFWTSRQRDVAVLGTVAMILLAFLRVASGRGR